MNLAHRCSETNAVSHQHLGKSPTSLEITRHDGNACRTISNPCARWPNSMGPRPDESILGAEAAGNPGTHGNPATRPADTAGAGLSITGTPLPDLARTTEPTNSDMPADVPHRN
jgi:hypothetical protein